MSEVASAYVSLLPSAKGFGSSAGRQIGPQMNSVAKTTGSRFGKVFAYSSMSPLKAIGAAAFGLFAVKKVKDFFSGAIDEARESQKVSALTAQVIKSTGGAAGISAKQVGNLANSISLMTGMDDEAIQGAENLLLTFTNLRNGVGKNNDIFNQATSIVTDMSVALDQDLKSSSIQVGKALNDPIKGITALSRVGVSFTEGQKKQIETLVKGGKTMDAQKIILGELNKEFGGAAGAAATSGDKFKTAFANLQEAVGLKLLPYLDQLLDKGTVAIGFLINQVPAGFRAFKDAISPVTDAIGDLVSNHLEVFKTVLAGITGGALAAIIGLIGGGLIAVIVALVGVLASPIVLIGALAGAAVYAYIKFESFRTLVQQVIAWFQTSFVPALMSAVAAVQVFATELWARIQPLLPQIQAIFGQIVSTIKSYLTLAAAEVKIAVAVIQFVWSHFNGTMLDYLVRTFQNIITAVKGALNIVQGVVRLVTALIKGDWSGAWDAIKQILKGAWQIIGAIVKQSVAQLQAVFGVLKTALPIIASKAWDLIKAAFVAGVKLAVKTTATLPGKALAALGDLSEKLIGAGEQLIAGFITGIGNKFGDVKDTLTGLTGKLTSWKGPPKKDATLLTPAGKLIIQGLIDGLVANEPGVMANLKGLTTAMEKGVLDGLTSLRDKAKGILDGLKSDFASLSSSVASAFTGDLFSGTNTHDFLLGLVNTKSELKGLKKAFTKLLGWGLDPKFLSALFSSGNGGLILDLASGTRASARLEARTANSVFGDIGSLSSSLGGQVAQADIGPKIDRTNQRLESIEKAIKSLPEHFGQEINKAVKHGQQKAS